MERIKLGVSSCLLGERVRYDGEEKQDPYLTEVLGKYVEWVPVCPETECGLPVPREPMKLLGGPEDPRLVTRETGIDHTGRLVTWVEAKIRKLEGEGLAGFVFKSRSPSCSCARGVKVFAPDGKSFRMGRGIFAGAFMGRFPYLPVEDEEGLSDSGRRESFIRRLFVFSRWRGLIEGKGSPGDLAAFHARHKLIFMAHSRVHLRKLGKLAAVGEKGVREKIFDEYAALMKECLKVEATVKKNVNVLQHMLGYFKKLLSAGEKEEILEVIEGYGNEELPLLAPVTLLRHYARKHEVTYLEEQYYLYPDPVELMMRNC
jgi:uncharacterized protein YbgA (DUF1722 family)/uncharacterized protein YbbK (DUF523 family)